MRPANRGILGITMVLFAVALSVPGRLRSAPIRTLPEQVADPGYIDKVPAPAGGKVMFFLFQPGSAAVFGVAEAGGTVIWQKSAGIRPLVSYFWSDDGKAVLYVTDCLQKEADLRSPAREMASYLFVLDAATGAVIGEGDLDTRILDLTHKSPEAVGAAHVIKSVTLVDGTVSAEIAHRKVKFTGSCPLKELPGPPVQGQR